MTLDKNSESYITDLQIRRLYEAGLPDPLIKEVLQKRNWKNISSETIVFDSHNTKLCPVSVLFDILKNNKNYHTLCKAVSNNENITEEMLEFLSYHHDDWVRASAAKNSKISLKLFEKLIKDSSAVVRASAVSNSGQFSKRLFNLINDPSEDVRSALAQRYDVSKKMLKILANDCNYYVRCAVAANAHLGIL